MCVFSGKFRACLCVLRESLKGLCVFRGKVLAACAFLGEVLGVSVRFWRQVLDVCMFKEKF